MLDLKEGAYVLDVGCGIGGSAFLMKYVPGSHGSFDVGDRYLRQSMLVTALRFWWLIFEHPENVTNTMIQHLKIVTIITSPTYHLHQHHWSRSYLWPLLSGTLIKSVFRRDYGAKVLGFDLSVNMIDIAQERLGRFQKFENQFHCVFIDCMKANFEFFEIQVKQNMVWKLT